MQTFSPESQNDARNASHGHPSAIASALQRIGCAVALFGIIVPLPLIGRTQVHSVRGRCAEAIDQRYPVGRADVSGARGDRRFLATGRRGDRSRASSDRIHLVAEGSRRLLVARSGYLLSRARCIAVAARFIGVTVVGARCQDACLVPSLASGHVLRRAANAGKACNTALPVAELPLKLGLVCSSGHR